MLKYYLDTEQSLISILTSRHTHFDVALDIILNMFSADQLFMCIWLLLWILFYFLFLQKWERKLQNWQVFETTWDWVWWLVALCLV